MQQFTIFELILIAACAALGIAIKPIVTPLVHIITGPLFIPSGSVAGGIYMMFIVAATLMVAKPGVATCACIIQAIMAIATGVIGGHGFLSLFTYVLPGIAMDIVRAFTRYRKVIPLEAFLIGALGNLAGTYAANLVFFRLPWLPLALSLTAGFLSGGLGGLVAYRTIKTIMPIIE